MMTTNTWWEKIFEGDLSIGVDQKRMSELEDENFLYFKDDELSQEAIQ